MLIFGSSVGLGFVLFKALGVVVGWIVAIVILFIYQKMIQRERKKFLKILQANISIYSTDSQSPYKPLSLVQGDEFDFFNQACQKGANAVINVQTNTYVTQEIKGGVSVDHHKVEDFGMPKFLQQGPSIKDTRRVKSTTHTHYNGTAVWIE